MMLRLVTTLITLSTAICVGQQPQASAARLRITLPNNVPTDNVWIRYVLYGQEGGSVSRGDTIKLDQAVGHFDVVAALDGMRTQEARVVVYAPGCQFAVYDVMIDHDLEEQFRCEPLPKKIIDAFIDPKDIPPDTFSAEKSLEVAGYFTADWVCSLFLEPRRGEQIGGGSCLGSGINLGPIGHLDPVNGGSFQIVIPDFTRDRVYEKFQKNFGVIQVSLKDKQFGRGLATIKASDAAGPGLSIQNEYRSPVLFTRVRP